MESKFQPFDINNYCRVYFAFLDKNNETTTLYYERPQIMMDQAHSSGDSTQNTPSLTPADRHPLPPIPK